ncbi:MAG: PRTRC system protein E [Ignavibacteriae bacterium]|nr:PRTRC system protein E [Ignavibacteriota bacterium]
MDFFKKMFEAIDYDVTFTVSKKENELTVLMQPISGKSKFPPFSVKGTPEELDEKFFEVFTEAIEKTKGLIQNINSFEKAVEEKANQVKKEATKKATTPKKESKVASAVANANSSPEEKTDEPEGSLLDDDD